MDLDVIISDLLITHAKTDDRLVNVPINEWINIIQSKAGMKEITFYKAITLIRVHPVLKLIRFTDKTAFFNINNNSKITIKVAISESNSSPTADEILDEVCRVTGYDREVLSTKNRKRELAETRQAYFLLAMEQSMSTLETIGAIVNRHYTSVLYARKVSHLPKIQKIIRQVNIL